MDPVSAARTARENLARGLSALQTPGIPPALVAVADPVAQAMSALHRIEASAGTALAESAPYALACIRQALGMLQTPGAPHPAVEAAMEAIAGSLGIVHQLTQLPVPQPAPAQAAPAQQAPAGAWHGPAAVPPAAMPPAAMPPAAMPPPSSAVSPYAGTQVMDQSLFQAPAVAAPAPPRAAAPVPPQAPPAPPGPAAVPAPAAPGAGAEAFPLGLPRVEAALGAHSPTNFYKGLSSNDIIESGGIFVATYKIPKVGSQVVVHLSLPGGYEFDALAVVRWAREAPSSGAGQRDAPPGFGAQFVQISPEGRQLVYRYVRNREPLFHDDF